MRTLRDYVNWGITHCDKTGSAEGVPLVMEKCVKNKRMKQLEVYGNSVQNGIPTPETPVEVESVGEKCTKNLYDAESYPMTKGYYIHGNSGSTATNASYSATMSYIPCSELRGETITFGHTGGNAPGIAYYDEIKTLISGVMNKNGTKITAVVPDNASYYRFCVKAEYADVAQVELGDTVTEYEPYGKYKIPVTARGKNIFNCKNSKSLYNGYVSSGSTQTTDSDISWVSQAGGTSAVHMDMGLLSQYVGKQLTLSFEVELVNGESISSTRFVVCTEKGQERTAVNGSISTKNGRYFITSTIPNRNENDHLTLRLYISSANPYTTYTFKNVMVSVMPGDVGFEPYVEPITTNIYLNEPLRKIGDYGDVLDFKNKKATRVIQRKVLDGSEVYISMKVQPHPYVFVVLGNYGTVQDDICLCNQLQYQSNFSYTREGINTFRVLNSTSSGYTSRCGFRIYENGEPITELEAVQALIAQKYTAGNPIVLYYALTTPYEETIECELPVLMAKTSIVEIDTNLLPSNIKGKYIKR